MKKPAISVGAMLSMSPIALLIVLGQQYHQNQQGHVIERSVQIDSFNEEQKGEWIKVAYNAIPASMRFQVVTPPASFGLVQVSTECWKCPKTTMRPAFAVLAVTYNDSKNLAAHVLVVEWKHVPGVAPYLSSGLPSGFTGADAKQGYYNSNSLIGSSQGTDVGIYSPDLPPDRMKQMSQWLQVDSVSLARLNATGGDMAQIERMRGNANTNARALATAVQGKAISNNKYDPKLSDYAADLGGSIPMNPCSGTSTGYTIRVQKETAQVAAQEGTRCGNWTPLTFSLTL